MSVLERERSSVSRKPAGVSWPYSRGPSLLRRARQLPRRSRKIPQSGRLPPQSVCCRFLKRLVEKLHQRFMQIRIGGEHIPAAEHARAAAYVGDIAAGFADDEDAGCKIPGRQVELPEAVESPGSDIGEVERGDAEAPDAARRGHHRGKRREIAWVVAAADEGNAGADQRLGEMPTRRDAQPAVVMEGAGALLRPEHLIAHRLVDHAGDDLSVALQPDRDGEMRDAVQKIGGAVQGIDDPAVMRVAAGFAAAFLHQEAVSGPRLAEFGAQHLLRLEIGGADEIAGPLERDLELFDLAEIADESARRLESGVSHHVDGSGARWQAVLILRPFEIGAVGGVDDDARAGGDMRRDHHAAAVLELAGLIGGRGGLPLYHWVGLDELHRDGLRQAHGERCALIELDGADHAFAEEIGGLADHLARDGELLVILIVHEGRHVAVEIEELHFLLVEADALHGLLRAEALVELRAATKITHLHLRKGAALSRLHQLAAHHQPELALMLQDIARLDVDGIDLHGARLAGAVERTGFGL